MLWVRRPDQFTHPYIWAETGRVILPAYADRGWASFIEPVAGYQVLPLKLIALTSFTLSFLNAPTIMFAMTVALTIGVTLAVALSPTHLRYPWACAVSCLLIPTGSEAFGVALMSFWWAGLLAFLALIWREGHERLRLAYVLIGGLSGPAIIALAPLFALRAAVVRRRPEIIAAGLAIFCAGIQVVSSFWAVWNVVRAKSVPLPWDVAGKFLGYFFAPQLALSPDRLPMAAVVGCIALLAIGVVLIRQREGLHFTFWLLTLAAIAMVASSLLRTPFEAIFPTLTTPRYFFYPFILTSWLLIWLAAEMSHAGKIAVATVFLSTYAQAAPQYRWRHVPIDWRHHIKHCALADTYQILAHTNGQLENAWRVPLTGKQCRWLTRRGWLRAEREGTISSTR
jgi:hypothetical protein